MSTIQQLKNFIRHGKQARANYSDPAKKSDHSPTPAQKVMANPTEPAPHAADEKIHPLPDAYSAHPGDMHNRVAQADGVAAHHAEANQNVTTKGKSGSDGHLVKLVQEENESRSKFPRYPGLERWELVEKMGDGAFSNVYRARDRQGGAGEVAIKVVRKFEMNNMQRGNILKEVQIMKQLDHPNIVKLVDFSESRQYYYIVLELAPGGELFHQIVRLTYFSEDLSRHVITQVAKALEYLHEEMGVVHRDIKPENILFRPIPFVPSKSPKPKQPGDEDKVDEGEFIPGVGSGGIGQIKNCRLWAVENPPEIVKDERYSKSVDMWALGCVLYTLLCGFPPFYDESIEVLTEKVAKGQFTFLSPWWDDISKSAQDLISHLLTVDPDKRYTIREFLAHSWIQGNGPTPRDEKKLQDPERLRAFDASKFIDGDKRMDFRSPGAVNLREIFDVGYSVHRQEEEAKRRKQVGPKAGGPSRLTNLNEESSDEEKKPEARLPVKSDDQQLEQSMRNANLGKDQERGRERARHEREARGYGQHSATVAQAARQQVRDRNKQRGAFELNLDGATLLGRRANKPTASVGGF
ncbi:hypothetical protein NPX13_g7936 [Xylaria arbuscula]|uniref:Protein kinase domain-containing protein n=1 Tax=Xylaria arbuscula TaxID=114810 RepID=A0A9W8TKN4_9PEZI|nr:hypothetical protein NPX13_g7936 [Xylaria arbuscula]